MLTCSSRWRVVERLAKRERAGDGADHVIDYDAESRVGRRGVTLDRRPRSRRCDPRSAARVENDHRFVAGTS